MWVIRVAIEPLNWAFVCDKSKNGNCLPPGFTHDEKDAKTYKTYEGAVRAEMKLRKEKGLTHNQTETSAAKVEPTTMKPRNRREALAIMGIRRKERRQAAFRSMAGDWSLNIADMQKQIDAAHERINSGFYLEPEQIDDCEEADREQDRAHYSFVVEEV